MQKRNIEVTQECFIHKDGKYLMLHRNPNKKIMPNVWMAPGGHREFNEGLFECTRREVMEETGLSIKNLRVKVTGCAYVKDIETEFYFHYILADYLDGELKQNPNDGEFVWVTIEEMKNLPNLLAEIHKLLPYIFDGTEKVYSIKAVYEKNILLDFILENS